MSCGGREQTRCLVNGNPPESVADLRYFGILRAGGLSGPAGGGVRAYEGAGHRHRGNSVKVLVTGETEPRKFPSGPTLTPRQMVSAVLKLTEDWNYDAVSIGYPAGSVTTRRSPNRSTWATGGSTSISQRHSVVP